MERNIPVIQKVSLTKLIYVPKEITIKETPEYISRVIFKRTWDISPALTLDSVKYIGSKGTDRCYSIIFEPVDVEIHFVQAIIETIAECLPKGAIRLIGKLYPEDTHTIEDYSKILFN